MSKLTTHKFCTLYEMGSGISSKPKQAGHGAPFLSFSTVFDSYFLPEQLDDLMDTSETEKKKYSVLKGDVFLTRTSETIDELGMSSVALKNYPNATYSGFLKRLRPIQDNVTYHKFMGFYLRSKMFRKTMTNNAVLTLRASLNEDIFSYLDLILPDYDEQLKIGDLLHLINQKIELNNRINAELEAMAKTLYDYWFLQFEFPDENGKPYKSSGGKLEYNEAIKRKIPARWEVKILNDITLNITRGISPKYTDSGGVCVLNQRCIRDNVISFHSSRRHEGTINDSKFLRHGDVLVNSTGVGTLGRVAFVKRFEEERITADSHVTIIRANHKCIRKLYFCYSMIKKQSEIEKAAEGSTGQVELSKGQLEQLKITIPKSDLQLKFDSVVAPIIQNASILEQENQQLAQQRDWLLPMLMNSQVKVS